MPVPSSSQQLLDASYIQLGFQDGELLNACEVPSSSINSDQWVEKGEWLALAKRVNAEKVFFVDNNPVIVFAQHPSSDPESQRERFRQIWNMARPSLLFLAMPGELVVYDLTRQPARDLQSWQESSAKRRLARATTVAEVATKLKDFRREEVESGRLFEEDRFGEDARADRALISDLRAVRDALVSSGGLRPTFAHRIIGRSIFIRYLEDRGILAPAYFEKVAGKKAQWRRILKQTPDPRHADARLAGRCYFRVLEDARFTYALYDSLSNDFNGDMFAEVHGERDAVTSEHLGLLRDFLCGSPARSPQLFFFAYDFSVVPIELISSIYEEFYNTEAGKQGNNGSHYTPPALVEFLLSQVLTADRLRQNPRILDPACGSGIFLVEAFRRIVRYRTKSQNGRRLSWSQLHKIIKQQICGVDINEEAVRVASLSLYLAFLHYLQPPDILEQIARGKHLPRLLCSPGRPSRKERQPGILMAGNAFESLDALGITECDSPTGTPGSPVNIVVGNPPWGSPREDDIPGRKALAAALDWCDTNDYPVGRKEWSQAFVWRARSLLTPGGLAGLLVSSGTLFKEAPKSKEFRHAWLQKTVIRNIVNFEHVRDVFFRRGGEGTRSSSSSRKSKGSVSPFISVVFEQKRPEMGNHMIGYWSARKTSAVQKTQTVLLSRCDFKLIRQRDVLNDDSLWKVYWWGNHHDVHLVSLLGMEEHFVSLSVGKRSLSPADFGRGLQKREKGPKDTELSSLPELRLSEFRRYGELKESELVTSPVSVARRGNVRLYRGLRLLVSRGIHQAGAEKGRLVARLEKIPFRFNDGVYGVRLPDDAEEKGLVLLGILWSSLCRYYLWMTCGSWNMWHPKISLDALKALPIRLPSDTRTSRRITGIVAKLRSDKVRTSASEPDLFDTADDSAAASCLQEELDDAVFDLYELTPAQRDLVRDRCNLGMDLFYRGPNSRALEPVDFEPDGCTIGTAESLKHTSCKGIGVREYLQAFLQVWNRELDVIGGEFVWQVICPRVGFPLLAIELTTQDKRRRKNGRGPRALSWATVMEKLDAGRRTPLGSRSIFVEGLIRLVSDTDILIVKENQKRLWTATAAREDAEATMVQAMQLEQANG